MGVVINEYYLIYGDNVPAIWAVYGEGGMYAWSVDCDPEDGSEGGVFAAIALGDQQ